MRHLYIRIYAFIAMLAIFFVVGMFVFHIIDDTNKEIDNAEVTFHKFEKAIAYELKNNLLEDEALRQRLRRLAKALELKGFVIQIAENAKGVFSYPSDSSLFAIVNGNVLIKEHSKFLKVFKTEGYTTIENSKQKICITVMMSVFPSKMLFIRSRTVFFFALALLLLTGLVRILLTLKPSERVERVYTKFDQPTEPSSYSYSSYQNTEYKAGKDFDDVLNATNKVEAYAEQIEDVLPRDALDASDLNLSTSFTSPSEVVEVPIISNEEPKGLYSPLTGFGWKEYLMERLDSEVSRATSTDQDMSFLIVKIKDIDFSSLSMENISKIFLEVFSFRDLIFEYSDESALGFAVILQDVYIDEALKMSDSLFLKLKNEIYLTGQEPTIGIGITTRACRLANAKIILNEAEEAVSRALKNKTPIVGFKPNAEKYRQQTIEGRD